MGGRIFTRVSDDVIKFSKLDRFLVSDKFYHIWDYLSAASIERTKSDHCPIVLKDDDKNFGPKPFKVFDVWFDEEDVEKVINDAWKKFGQLDIEIKNHKYEALKLGLKAETVCVDENELEAWKQERKAWMDKEKIKASMIEQKARVRWALEGLNINGSCNEYPNDIKEEAYNHFKGRFDEPDTLRPSMEDLCYPSISHDESVALELDISESEIREAINDCGSTKAPGLDGFNLRFSKNFGML
ncbi:uncharacterized protein [Rutidosis leptorrhynchoides]|uniref:uncharacterized protein n=1 Tax=Rutidosis leptorrhynchoides TaxID=125765 RepID=UPI003A99306D